MRPLAQTYSAGQTSATTMLWEVTSRSDRASPRTRRGVDDFWQAVQLSLVEPQLSSDRFFALGVAISRCERHMAGPSAHHSCDRCLVSSALPAALQRAASVEVPFPARARAVLLAQACVFEESACSSICHSCYKLALRIWSLFEQYQALHSPRTWGLQAPLLCSCMLACVHCMACESFAQPQSGVSCVPPCFLPCVPVDSFRQRAPRCADTHAKQAFYTRRLHAGAHLCCCQRAACRAQRGSLRCLPQCSVMGRQTAAEHLAPRTGGGTCCGTLLQTSSCRGPVWAHVQCKCSSRAQWPKQRRIVDLLCSQRVPMPHLLQCHTNGRHPHSTRR
jgi:hypothetical protein